MNIINNFFKNQTLPELDHQNTSFQNDNIYQVALDALLQTNEWLKDPELFQRIVSRLESIEPQSSESCMKTAAVYHKIFSKKAHWDNTVRIAQVQISDNITYELPITLLLAESPVFKQMLHNRENTLNLSREASPVTLEYLLSYLKTGKTDSLEKINAVELLLLAKKFEITNLSMRCLDHLLNPKNKISIADHDLQTPTEENELRTLIQELRKQQIYISKTNFDNLKMVKMKDGSQPSQWECLSKLHQFLPVNHLKVGENPNLKSLNDFVQQHPNLISLSIISYDLDDRYLEELSKNLSNLHSFFISSGKITTIPEAICNRITRIACSGCMVLTSLHAPNATDVDCRQCYNLISLHAPNATEVNCSDCSNKLTSLHTPNAIKVNCSGCFAMTNLYAPNATDVDCRNCHAMTSLHLPNAIEVHCDDCVDMTSLHVPNTTEVYCSRCYSLTSLHAPNATKVNCGGCSSLTTLHAPNATKVYCGGCSSLTTLHAPLLDSINPFAEWICKMPEARRINDADLFDQILTGFRTVGDLFDQICTFRTVCDELLPAQFEIMIVECEFKAKLLRGENISYLIDPLKARLTNPATAEQVVGELANFSKWAAEVAGHEHLSLWLFNLKEEIRRTIEAIHTNATFRTLLNAQYQEIRTLQKQNLQEKIPEINLSLFLDNNRLRACMRSLFVDVKVEDLNALEEKFGKTLEIQLPILYQEEPDHHARKAKILSLIDRIARTKDYAIDPEGVTKHMNAIINSVCLYNSKTGIKYNTAYLTHILDALYEGANECENRAADALYKSEEVFFEEKFKKDKALLYGIVLMQWKRRFIEQYVRQHTLPTILSDLEGSRMVDIEVIMANSQAFDPLLDLNLDIKEVKYLDDIKEHLRRNGKSDHLLANPEELFHTLMEATTKEFWLDQFFYSHIIQKLHVVDPNFYHDAQHVREQVGGLFVKWGGQILDKTGEEETYYRQLEEILNRYEGMKDFSELKEQFHASVAALKAIYAAGKGDDDKETEIIDKLSIDLSNAQEGYRKDVFNTFKDRITQDLIDTGYFVLPASAEGTLSLNYPDPATLSTDPNAIIDAALTLNVEDWPTEFRDAEALPPQQSE